VHPLLEERLTANGFTCDHDYTSSYDALLQKLPAYTGLVVRSRIPIDAALLAAAPRLRFIARSGSGLENIDVEAARRAGIRVVNSPEGNRDAVAEHALGMLLMLLNRLHLADAEVRRGLWRREANRGRELKSLTVGIIGYGHMGSAFAERLTGMGCRILAHDAYKSGFGTVRVEACSLDTVYRDAHVVSLHLPLSAETHHYVSHAFIARMQRPFYLINTARGAHVDTAALVQGLAQGKVLGACLDVLEYEKSSFEGLTADAMPAALAALLRSEQVVLSPHVAGWTVESYEKLSAYLAEKILREH
jgi:D-3-phosphoglycerate dehydrogenase